MSDEGTEVGLMQFKMVSARYDEHMTWRALRRDLSGALSGHLIDYKIVYQRRGLSQYRRRQGHVIKLS